MGWSGHKLKDGNVLWTRHGFCGLYIQTKDGEEIEIDEGLLWSLAADEIRSQKISKLEGDSDSEILGINVPDYNPDDE